MSNPNLTPSGVCYNLYKSPFRFVYGGYEWYFSSHQHMLKFQQKVKIRTDWLTDSLSNRFHFIIDASLVAMFQLYRQVETRGFYVVSVAGQEFQSINDVTMKVKLNEPN